MELAEVITKHVEREREMTVREMNRYLECEVLAGANGLDKEIRGGYTGDLLSIVIASAKEKDIWVTVQGHINAIAVAVMVDLSAVVLAQGVKADEEMINRANMENIPLLRSSLTSFKLTVMIQQYL